MHLAHSTVITSMNFSIKISSKCQEFHAEYSHSKGQVFFVREKFAIPSLSHVITPKSYTIKNSSKFSSSVVDSEYQFRPLDFNILTVPNASSSRVTLITLNPARVSFIKVHSRNRIEKLNILLRGLM